MLPGPRSTPFSFWYLVLLVATSITRHLLDPATAQQLLTMASSNTQNLADRPLLSLLTSALVLKGDDDWGLLVPLFLLAAAPLERRVGARWTLAVFAFGHVFATLATELPAGWAQSTGRLPAETAQWVDVGASYGLFATAGALMPILATRTRWWILPLVELAIVGLIFVEDPTAPLTIMTFAGHLIAFHSAILVWWRLLRRRGLVATLRIPDLSVAQRDDAPPMKAST